jgi:lysophospholipase L1-like esterase
MIDGSKHNRTNKTQTLIREVVKEIPVNVYVDREVPVEKIVEVEKIIEHFVPVESIRYLLSEPNYKLETVSVPDVHYITQDREVHVNHVVKVVPKLIYYLAALAMVLAFLFGHLAHAQGGGSGISGGTSRITPTNPFAGNINPFLMPHWTSCVANVKINAGNCRVYAIGDSTTFGAFCILADTGNLTACSYPTRLSQYLNTTVLPAQRDSFMGCGNPSVETTCTDDARVTIGGWIQGDVDSTGGLAFKATATGASMTFLPTDQVNTFRIWYIASGGLGTFSYAVNGGTATNVNTNVSSVPLQSVTTTATLGSNTLDLTWVSGTVYVVGVEASNSAIGTVQIINAGWSASTSSSWANAGANPWNPVQSVPTQAPDVVLLDLGINDWQGAVPVATYTANMQTLITAFKATSDVILVTPDPSAISTGIPLATQQKYITALYQLAQNNHIPIIDNFSRWGSYERTNVSPFLYYNQVLHPSATGYSDFAQSIAVQLLSVVGH